MRTGKEPRSKGQWPRRFLNLQIQEPQVPKSIKKNRNPKAFNGLSKEAKKKGIIL